MTVADALKILDMSVLPSSHTVLTAAVCKILRRAHPDRKFNSKASHEESQRVLAARAVLQEAINTANAANIP